jgi:hypothetical protein
VCIEPDMAYSFACLSTELISYYSFTSKLCWLTNNPKNLFSVLVMLIAQKNSLQNIL